MNLALNELKVQAKVMLKEIRSEVNISTKTQRQLKLLKLNMIAEVKLKHCQFLIAKQYGFDSWQHAQQIFSGSALPNEERNMGTLFHSPRCDALINLWFADYESALEALYVDTKNRWLVPYKKQYIVVNREYLKMVGLDNDFDEHWHNIDHDLVSGYCSESWDKLALAVLKNSSGG
jgi:hypothetical protein